MKQSTLYTAACLAVLNSAFMGAASSPTNCPDISCEDIQTACNQACETMEDDDVQVKCKDACGGHMDWCQNLCPDNNEDGSRKLHFFDKKSKNNKKSGEGGYDRDAHGCIGSAGYTWCASLGECVRNWETPCPTDAPIAGNDKDKHGCIGSAGYSWCPTLGECIQEFDTPCPKDPIAGNDRDEHGCIGSAGYTWCPALGGCVRDWETPCPGGNNRRLRGASASTKKEKGQPIVI